MIKQPETAKDKVTAIALFTNWVASWKRNFVEGETDNFGFIHITKMNDQRSRSFIAEPAGGIIDWGGVAMVAEVLMPGEGTIIMEACREAQTEYITGSLDECGNEEDRLVRRISFEDIGRQLAERFGADPRKYMAKWMGSKDKGVRILAAGLMGTQSRKF